MITPPNNKRIGVNNMTNIKDSLGIPNFGPWYIEILPNQDDKIVGYGRLIGDGICFMYIQDIMVLPEYQNKKIGTLIMNNLLEKIKELKKKNPELLTYLGASEGKEAFYEKFGFKKRIDVGLGHGMVLE